MTRRAYPTATAVAAMLAVAATQTAHAQQKYPTKPIRMLVAFTAGSQTDILARAIGQ